MIVHQFIDLFFVVDCSIVHQKEFLCVSGSSGGDIIEHELNSLEKSLTFEAPNCDAMIDDALR